MTKWETREVGGSGSGAKLEFDLFANPSSSNFHFQHPSFTNSEMFSAGA